MHIHKCVYYKLGIHLSHLGLPFSKIRGVCKLLPTLSQTQRIGVCYIFTHSDPSGFFSSIQSYQSRSAIGQLQLDCSTTAKPEKIAVNYKYEYMLANLKEAPLHTRPNFSQPFCRIALVYQSVSSRTIADQP